MKPEQNLINIGINILQVKKKDLIVQDATAMTMIDGKKADYLIPFTNEVRYSFDSLMKNFTFKFAILQQEDILGLLYLEIPFKYKFTKKFKIDDWYQLKPFEKGITKAVDSSLVARVVINYDANCKLDEKEYASYGHLQEVQKSPKSDFKTRLKKIKKMANTDDKENMNYLDEVERNIMLRRRDNRDPLGVSADKNSPAKLLRSTKSANKLKGSLSRTMTSRKLGTDTTVTPDSLYRTVGGGDSKSLNDEKLMERMQLELVHSRKELKELREKLKKMEDGQMTVDNLQLSKRLDEEREALNRERGHLLKEYAKLFQELDVARKKYTEDKSRAEEDLIKRKNELEKSAKDLELQKKQFSIQLEDLKTKADAAEAREKKIVEGEQDLLVRIQQLDKQKVELGEYQNELNELKDRLLQEREKIMKEKQGLEGEKADLERDIKGLKALKEAMEKEKEKEQKDAHRRRNDLHLLEDKLTRENERLGVEEERLKKDRARADEEVKKYKLLSEELEEEKLKIWRDRNNLNNEVRQFIEDRKKMESDLKWREREIDQIEKDIERDLEDLEKEREELLEMQDRLEEFKLDIQTRERKLIDEREDFNAMKLRFIEGLMESGGLSHLTPELKAMAKQMGVDVDEMMREKDHIEARKRELERLQRQNEDELASMRLKVTNTGMAFSSRRSSVLSQRRASLANALKKGANNPLANKMTAESYLGELYDNASNNYIVKTLKDNKERIETLTEEKLFAQKMIDQLRTENKQLVRDFDLLTKIIEQYRGEGLKIDINTILGRFKSREMGTWTGGDFDDVSTRSFYDEDRAALERRVRELEAKLRRGSIGGSMEDGDYDSRLQAVLAQLREMMVRIETEQTEFHREGMPEVAQRLRNIHFLVYSFIQDIIQFQMRFHRPRDETERETFVKILKAVNFTQPSADSPQVNLKTVMGQSAVEVSTDLQDLVRRLQIRVNELEHHNVNLKTIVEGMKSTFDFFEFANDQYIMNKH